MKIWVYAFFFNFLARMFTCFIPVVFFLNNLFFLVLFFLFFKSSSSFPSYFVVFFSLASSLSRLFPSTWFPSFVFLFLLLLSPFFYFFLFFPLLFLHGSDLFREASIVWMVVVLFSLLQVFVFFSFIKHYLVDLSTGLFFPLFFSFG